MAPSEDLFADAEEVGGAGARCVLPEAVVCGAVLDLEVGAVGGGASLGKPGRPVSHVRRSVLSSYEDQSKSWTCTARTTIAG